MSNILLCFGLSALAYGLVVAFQQY